MANNYTQFAGILTHLTDDEEKWLRHALRDIEDTIPDDPDEVDRIKAPLAAAEPWRDEESENCTPDFQSEFHENRGDGRYLHMYAEEYGGAWACGQLVHAFFKKFRPTEIWSTTWANTCSKMRVDEFGGGAVVVTAKEVRAMSADTWVERQRRHFKRTGELPPVRKVKRYKEGRFGGMTGSAIVEEMGWNTASLSQHMASFIDERGLSEAYVNFLASRAKAEEEAG